MMLRMTCPPPSLQLLIGLGSYVYPKAPLSHRMALSPVHKFLGISTWVLGLMTMMVGESGEVPVLCSMLVLLLP